MNIVNYEPSKYHLGPATARVAPSEGLSTEVDGGMGVIWAKKSRRTESKNKETGHQNVAREGKSF